MNHLRDEVTPKRRGEQAGPDVAGHERAGEERAQERHYSEDDQDGGTRGKIIRRVADAVGARWALADARRWCRFGEVKFLRHKASAALGADNPDAGGLFFGDKRMVASGAVEFDHAEILFNGDIKTLTKFLITAGQRQWCGKFDFNLLALHRQAGIAVIAGIITAEHRNKLNARLAHFAQLEG